MSDNFFSLEKKVWALMIRLFNTDNNLFIININYQVTKLHAFKKKKKKKATGRPNFCKIRIRGRIQYLRSSAPTVYPISVNIVQRPTDRATTGKGLTVIPVLLHVPRYDWTDLLSACCHAWPASLIFERSAVEPPNTRSDFFRKEREREKYFSLSEGVSLSPISLSLSLPAQGHLHFTSALDFLHPFLSRNPDL